MYIEKKWIVTGTVKPYMKPALLDFLHQIHMRESRIEYSPMILFNPQMQAQLPLGINSKLASHQFELPISFIYGDNDWVQIIEEDIADRVLEQNQFYQDSDDEE